MSLADLFANNYFVRLVRGRTGDYDLIVSMVGVKLGERLLQIGGGDGRLLAALGAKTGLTGQVSAVEVDAEVAAQVKEQATKEGVLSDVEVAPFTNLPFDSDSFDIVIIPYADGKSGVRSAAEAFRVLRLGGRCSVVTREANASIPDQLQQHGFKAARLLAEREGYKFYEAIKK